MGNRLASGGRSLPDMHRYGTRGLGRVPRCVRVENVTFAMRCVGGSFARRPRGKPGRWRSGLSSSTARRRTQWTSRPAVPGRWPRPRTRRPGTRGRNVGCRKPGVPGMLRDATQATPVKERGRAIARRLHHDVSPVRAWECLDRLRRIPAKAGGSPSCSGVSRSCSFGPP